MAKKKTTKTKRKNYEYVGKFYVCCSKPVPLKTMADWFAKNAFLDVDFENGDDCPFDDGVGISIEWDTLKESK